MSKSKIVPVEKSSYIPGYGVLSTTNYEVQEDEEIVTIPNP